MNITQSHGFTPEEALQRIKQLVEDTALRFADQLETTDTWTATGGHIDFTYDGESGSADIAIEADSVRIAAKVSFKIFGFEKEIEKAVANALSPTEQEPLVRNLRFNSQNLSLEFEAGGGVTAFDLWARKVEAKNGKIIFTLKEITAEPSFEEGATVSVKLKDFELDPHHEFVPGLYRASVMPNKNDKLTTDVEFTLTSEQIQDIKPAAPAAPPLPPSEPPAPPIAQDAPEEPVPAVSGFEPFPQGCGIAWKNVPGNTGYGIKLYSHDQSGTKKELAAQNFGTDRNNLDCSPALKQGYFAQHQTYELEVTTYMDQRESAPSSVIFHIAGSKLALGKAPKAPEKRPDSDTSGKAASASAESQKLKDAMQVVKTQQALIEKYEKALREKKRPPVTDVPPSHEPKAGQEKTEEAPPEEQQTPPEAKGNMKVDTSRQNIIIAAVAAAVILLIIGFTLFLRGQANQDGSTVSRHVDRPASQSDGWNFPHKDFLLPIPTADASTCPPEPAAAPSNSSALPEMNAQISGAPYIGNTQINLSASARGVEPKQPLAQSIVIHADNNNGNIVGNGNLTVYGKGFTPWPVGWEPDRWIELPSAEYQPDVEYNVAIEPGEVFEFRVHPGYVIYINRPDLKNVYGYNGNDRFCQPCNIDEDAAKMENTGMWYIRYTPRPGINETVYLRFKFHKGGLSVEERERRNSRHHRHR